MNACDTLHSRQMSVIYINLMGQVRNGGRKTGENGLFCSGMMNKRRNSHFMMCGNL